MPNNDIDTTREIRVFLSSTFKDMQAERDYLLKHVFPEVRERCSERGVGFTEIDLRWGVTEEEAKNGTTIAICLSEIDRCRGFPPFFIGFLGERYGWVPSREELAFYLERRDLCGYAAEIEKALKAGISVTELEFQYALQGQQQDQVEALFYLRNPDLTQTLFQQSGNIQKSDFYDAADGKMAALKRYLRNSSLLEIDNYESVQVFGDSIKEQLLAELARRYPQSESEAPNLQLRRPHINFARTRLTCYVPLANARRDILEYCRKRLSLEEKRICLVRGESGLGKSALIADLARYLPTQILDADVIDYYVGANGQRSIEQWRDELVSLLTAQSDAVHEIKNHQELDRWQVLEAQLHKISSSRKGKTLILLLDALNQAVDVAAALHHLQQMSIPHGVILILSATPEVETNETYVRTYQFSKPDPAQLRDMIGAYTHNYRKELAQALVERLAGASAAALPLYLRVVLEQLRVRAVHESLPHDLEALLQYPSVGDLFQHLLETWDRDLSDIQHPRLVSRLAGLLAVSRVGLSEVQVGELMASETDPEDFLTGRPRLPRQLLSQVLAVLRPYLLRNDGREQLMHNALQSAVLNYCEEQTLRKKLINGCASHSEWDVTERIYQHGLLAVHYFKSGSKQHLVAELSRPENLKSCYSVDRGALMVALQALGANESSLNRHTEVITASWLREFNLLGDFVLNMEITLKLLENSFLNVGVVWAEQNLKIARRDFPIGHPSVAICLVNLAVGYRALDRLAEAESRAQEALEISRKNLPEGDINFAFVLSCMANIFCDQKRPDEAEPLYLEALAIYRKAMPEGHPCIASVGNSLLELYISKKRIDDAEILLKEVLTFSWKNLAEGHPEFARAYTSLGQIDFYRGKFDTAESMVLEAIRIRRNALSAAHPDNARCLNILGAIYRAQGRLDEAKAMDFEALRLSRAALPEEHSSVQQIRGNYIARAIGILGSPTEATPSTEIEKLRATFLTRYKILPKQHPDIADALVDLADAYNKEKQFENAEPLYLKALTIYREVLPQGDPSLAVVIANTATFYRENSMLDKAEPLYFEALDILNKNLPVGHPDILGCLTQISAMYAKQILLFFRDPLSALKAGWGLARLGFIYLVK
jgi:tetratricopeptide (TPR) repeat protein